ncbi:hypothetical protein ACWCV9_20495 [Streptomyces sp. NPDC001606]
MAKRMDVGRSGWRTNAKHNMLNQLIGQEVGASPRLPKAPRRLVWFDLTAGDAAVPGDEEWRRSCSPGILAYHASKSQLPVVVNLYEINPETYGRLLANLAVKLPEFGYRKEEPNRWRCGRSVLQVFNQSGVDADIGDVRSYDAVFVINDPNSITEWAMRMSFSREISSRNVTFFRSLTTMGCNASGLKRNKETRRTRIECVDRVGAFQRSVPRFRDLCFAAIIRDDAQWAYLIETSDKWREKTEQLVRGAFKKYDRGTSISWYRTAAGQFRGDMLRLFLTKAEREGIRGHEDRWLTAPLVQRIEMIGASEEAPVPEAPVQMGLWPTDVEDTPA